MARQPNRPPPLLPVTAMQTYAISAPRSTHWRKALCEEIDCAAYLRGWRSIIDESTERGQAQAHYIRKLAGRRFTETRTADNPLTVFEFEAGQVCFGTEGPAHRVQIREETYFKRAGDWRGNPDGKRIVQIGTGPRGARRWVDDFGENQERIIARQQRG